MSKNQKGVVDFIVVLILGFVMLVGITFYGYKNGQINLRPVTNNQNVIFTPTPSQTFDISLDEITEWKTYTNSQIGFSISYPASWYFYDKGFNYIDPIDGLEKWYKAKEVAFFSPEKFPDSIGEGTEFYFDGFKVGLSEPRDKDGMVSSFDKIYNNSDPSMHIKVGNIRIVKQVNDNRVWQNVPEQIRSPFEGIHITYYLDFPSTKSEILTLQSGQVDKSKYLNEEILDYILSTFKFTD